MASAKLHLDQFLHGGDYNPDQWLDEPSVLCEDLRLMELAGCNAASIGIFAWTRLEPREGEFDFEWLDGLMEDFGSRGWKVALATPSAAVPHWMTRRYPEMLRVTADRRRELPGNRVKYCLTSPVLRDRVRRINGALARRYAGHPPLMLWHLSNEYGHYDHNGGCHCELCQSAFREWLKGRYQDDLERLNRAWWTSFWSHRYTEWEQIESPAPHGENCTHGLQLDWRRFVTEQTISFIRNEAAPLREATPDIPLTTNLMECFAGLDYWKLAKELDVVSWDSYPLWHMPDGEDREHPELSRAAVAAFHHDLFRSLGGGRPFLLMESTPSNTNWQPVGKLKRPGMHRLSSLQAVAHGSDSVMYFQWRKGRGGSEKFHGAVIDHVGHENTRVFRGVADVGAGLKRIAAAVGSETRAEVAVVFDWENWWAIDHAAGPRIEKKDYPQTCVAHYRALWELGVPVDIVGEDSDLSRYRLVVAPMLHMVREGLAERLEEFVRRGGTLVTTYWSGIVDASDLVFTGGWPGPLRALLGIWVEEIDSLYAEERNRVQISAAELGLAGSYECRELCELIHAETAEVLGVYEQDFYAGMPALTVNRFGEGAAYHVASRNDQRFIRDFLSGLVGKLELKRDIATELPRGVVARARHGAAASYLFVQNFVASERSVPLPETGLREMLQGVICGRELVLPPFGVAALELPRSVENPSVR